MNLECLSKKVGPGHLNFVKVLPEIGPLFTPDRSKSNNLLFYFDKVTKAENYKLYDYDISEGFTGTLQSESDGRILTVGVADRPHCRPFYPALGNFSHLYHPHRNGPAKKSIFTLFATKIVWHEP